LKLGEAGEFGLIERIRRLVDAESEDIVLGIGDDAAVFRPVQDHLAVITTDAMIEGVHFNLDYTPIESLGWKALAINISDVAAMGGIPRYAVISLAVPEKWSVEDVESLYRGVSGCGKEYNCIIIGGDTVRSRSDCFISVTVVGEVEKDAFVRRSGALAGDFLCVTGPLGRSRTGLEVLKAKKNGPDFPRSVKRFLEPRPLVQEARRLIRELGVTSMIDISDGLASEIHHICHESKLGCIVREENIPISEETIRWTEEKHVPPVQFVLQSGEEYELLFTAEKSRIDKWRNRKNNDWDIIPIGEMVPENEGVLMDRDGKRCRIPPNGWDHFRV
jgi:thiamine-monophosphate kinase